MPKLSNVIVFYYFNDIKNCYIILSSLFCLFIHVFGGITFQSHNIYVAVQKWLKGFGLHYEEMCLFKNIGVLQLLKQDSCTSIKKKQIQRK